MADTTAPTDSTFTCVSCGPLPKSQFWPSSLRNAHHRCKKCALGVKRAYRAKLPPSLMLAVKEVRSRERLEAWTAAEHAAVLERYGGRCVLTGETQGLTLCKCRPADPFGVDNCAPLCTKAAEKWAYVVPEVRRVS